MDSEEEDYYHSSGDDVASKDYGGDDDVASEDDDGDVASADDGCAEEPDETLVSRHRKNYTVLKEEDIRKLVDNEISTVCSVLLVSRGVACYLLCRNNNWSLNAAYKDWLSNEEQSPEPVARSVKQKLGQVVCKICYELLEVENVLSLTCGHPFCEDCWRAYISTSIRDGPGCLMLSCPEPACQAPAGLDIAELLATDDEKQRFYKYLMESYIEGTMGKKWCPAPGCDFAVQFAGAGETYDVVCGCRYKFCWNCEKESHRPTDCKTAQKWIQKSSNEGENVTWMISHTKPCPECLKSIEKNQGCNHMVCRCGHHFCWVCLNSWDKHTDFYRCNQFVPAKEPATDEEKDRQNAKLMVERYAHYYERWVSNDKSMKMALSDLSRARVEHVDQLARLHCKSQAQLSFVTEAWEQIIDCRRVLKWSYAYGYYMDNKKNKRKMTFFEYLQGQAESALERLHHCAEKEMKEYLEKEDELCDLQTKKLAKVTNYSVGFSDFRSKLTMLTGVTRDHFENLVRALENNLSEVKS